ncbi:ABC transporter permease [Enterovibrio sp. ZSDZ35]|uniref:ABC transporter permease n=1 Tax=Enterovibrio qingdaonensis TaxID=2899818 RepID=A0ABT5QPH3_9GAMM|nr:ABC transporter permease [Enterovibrio sp. ZSDZ35]MDD1782779.1 ABC transporter permease [Enterovibrio sp. ZSDZ35]
MKDKQQSLWRYGGAISFFLLLGFNVLFTPNFLHMQTLFVNISQVATIAIVAIGMTLVIATAGIDLSVGAVMALAGALSPLIFTSSFAESYPALGLTAAIIIPLFVAALCGMFNGYLICNWGIQPIIATLILFISGRGISQVLTNGNLQTFNNEGFAFLGRGEILGLPFQGWLMLVLAIIFSFIVRRTAFGRYLLSVGGNERSAHLAGVPVKKVKIAAYATCSVLAGIAGMIVVSINSASDAARNGELMELDAIAAAVVGGAVLQGGKAPIFGAVFGAVIIQLVKYTLLANGVEDEVALIAKALIIVLAVYVQQTRRAG